MFKMDFGAPPGRCCWIAASSWLSSLASKQTKEATMARTTEDAAAKTVSPTSGIKRERSDDEEAPTRQVSQRTSNNKTDEEPKSMVDIVTQTLRSDDEKVLENALGNLCKFIRDENSYYKPKKNQNEFFQVGGHVVVVVVMNEHPNCKIIQEHGMQVLGEATSGNGTLSAAVAKIKGMQATLLAMRKYPKEREIQHQGLILLYNLIRNSATGRAELLVELEGIPLILETMKGFPEDNAVVKAACDIWSKLCCGEKLRNKMFLANVASALATAIESHKDDDDIQNAGREHQMPGIFRNQNKVCHFQIYI
jgi:hypothetical protein